MELEKKIGKFAYRSLHLLYTRGMNSSILFVIFGGKSSRFSALYPETLNPGSKNLPQLSCYMYFIILISKFVFDSTFHIILFR
jgi:hypothetical protein